MPTSIRELGWADLLARANTGLIPANQFKRDDLWAVRTDEMDATTPRRIFYPCQNPRNPQGFGEEVVDRVGYTGAGALVKCDAWAAFEIIQEGDGNTPPGQLADAALIDLEQKVCGIRSVGNGGPIIFSVKEGLTIEKAQAEVPVAKATLCVRMRFQHVETDPTRWS